MKQAGIFEVKTRLSEFVDAVERGEEVVITRRGKPVARLVPVEENRRMSAQQAVKDIRELRKGLSLGGLDWKELRDEGRR